MAKPKIVITSPMNFLPQHIERLNKLGDVTIYDTLPTNPEEWMKRTENADIICSGKYGLKENIYQRPNVFYSLPFVAIGWIDKQKIKSKDITVSYCPGCNSYAVSEWIITMTLLLLRKFNRLVDTKKLENKTGSADYFGLAGKKACILGKGNVGSKVGKIYRALDIKVDYFKRGDSLIEKVKNCQIVVNTLNSNPSTKGLLDKYFFNSFTGNCFFITVTAFGIYDTEAMLSSLESNKLTAAADDCGSILPGDYNDPYYQKLIKNPKILATPHIAYQSDVTIKISNDMMIDNIKAYLQGKPINLI